MKKALSIILIVVLTVTVTSCDLIEKSIHNLSHSKTGSFESDEYSYDIYSDSYIEINKYKGDKTNLEIPEKIDDKPVRRIDYHAFEDCDFLESVSVPDSVDHIGMSAFENCTSLERISLGSSVSYLGDYAFSHCTSLKSIKLPSSIGSIGRGAFRECTSLEEVELSPYLSGIGSKAFYGCKSLKSISMGSKVEKIYTNAFSHCSSLKSVVIGSHVAKIDGNPFAYCGSLEEITVDKHNTTFDSRENCNAIIETETDTLICGCNHTTLPASVKSIDINAFTGCSFYVGFKFFLFRISLKLFGVAYLVPILFILFCAVKWGFAIAMIIRSLMNKKKKKQKLPCPPDQEAPSSEESLPEGAPSEEPTSQDTASE